MQLWYLECLRTWTKQKGRAPTIQELAGWLRKSETAVYSALCQLEHKGWTTRVGGKGLQARRFVAVAVEGADGKA